MFSPFYPGGDFLVVDTPAGDVLIPEFLDVDTRAMADAAAEFLRGRVLPASERLQVPESGLMPSLLKEAGLLGLMGLEVPEQYGGLGLSKSASARIAEALAAEPSFAVSHNVHTSVATLPLVFFGTDEQKVRYLPRLASGEWIGAYALSEAHAGTDALAARCRATPSQDGGYALTGEKMWITNAAFADLFVVFAKIEGQDKLTAFLVERGFLGVSIGKEEHKIGLKGSSTARLILDSVPVPAANRLGEAGRGAQIALYTLNLGRFKIAASSVGQGKHLLDIAARYALQRRAFGKPIADHGLIQQKLARMAATLFACESMLYRVAGHLDSAFTHHASRITHHPAEEYAVECALLKVACTQALDICADECLQIHGGYGYTEEYEIGRAWRDARVNRIYEGTNEINRLNVVQLLLRRIESGRIDLARAPRMHDVQSGSFDALRAILVSALEAAMEQFGPNLADEQMVCGELADMTMALFAAESAEIRHRRIVETGASEQRWQAASTAASLTCTDAEEQFRSGLARIYGAIGPESTDEWHKLDRLLSPHPTDTFAQMRSLARAVIVAEGYCW